MVKCLITIREIAGNGYYVDVVPDQSKATPKEMRLAGCMNAALDEVANYLMRNGGRGEQIESYDAEAVREIVKRNTSEFDSEP